MHLYIFVEDLSGKEFLDRLMPKILGDRGHTFELHHYKGIGRIPQGMTGKTDLQQKRLLLDNLPKILAGLGRTIKKINYKAAVIVVCDLDKKCFKKFRQELLGVLEQCNPKPETRFCIAREEVEAWFLGDIPAVKAAYPQAKDDVLNKYHQDSICGTWEVLSNAVDPKGSKNPKGWQEAGRMKSDWAERITPHMDISKNKSPSFCYFRDKCTELIEPRSRYPE